MPQKKYNWLPMFNIKETTDGQIFKDPEESN